MTKTLLIIIGIAGAIIIAAFIIRPTPKDVSQLVRIEIDDSEQFSIGNEIKGINYENLTVELEKYQKAKPEAKYYVSFKEKCVPDREIKIRKAIRKAGITLQHFYVDYNDGPSPVDLGPDKNEPLLTSQEWYEKGQELKKQGKYNEAIEALNKAMGIDPENSVIWYQRACLCSVIRNKENALKALASAISRHPKHKEDAKKDEAFQWLWEDEEFKKLTQ